VQMKVFINSVLEKNLAEVNFLKRETTCNLFVFQDVRTMEEIDQGPLNSVIERSERKTHSPQLSSGVALPKG
jgi:hypothetical protein